jgi:hypothetical protein
LGLAILTVLMIAAIAAHFAPVTTPMPATSVHEKVSADEAPKQQDCHPVVEYPLHGLFVLF